MGWKSGYVSAILMELHLVVKFMKINFGKYFSPCTSGKTYIFGMTCLSLLIASFALHISNHIWIFPFGLGTAERGKPSWLTL